MIGRTGAPVLALCSSVLLWGTSWGASSTSALGKPALAQGQQGVVVAPEDADLSDPVFVALLDELARGTADLSSGDGDAPYFIGLQVIETQGIQVLGEEGALQGYSPTMSRWVHADVRFGSPDLDSTHPLRGTDWDEPPSPGRELGLGVDAAVLRMHIWAELEAQARAARDRWERVQSYQRVMVAAERPLIDLAPAPVEVAVGQTVDLSGLDRSVWEDTVAQVSEVFSRSTVAMDPSVLLAAQAENRWFVSSDGHRIRQGSQRYRAVVSVDAVAEDGEQLALSELVDASDPGRLPSPEELTGAAKRLEEQIQRLLQAPEQEPYQGPVLLSGRAAAVFFHEIFGHRVEGHRIRRIDDAQTFADRVGQRVLPEFLSVVDDPTLDQIDGTDLAGGYRFDDEGVQAERVVLVRDGVLERFLESRAPARRQGRSNGHGRRQAGHSVVARQGNLMVQSAGGLSDAELRRRTLDAASAAGLTYALAVDDIAGGFTFTDRAAPNAFQIDVLGVRRMWVDGRPDEWVRGGDLIGTPLQTFARIEAAGIAPEVFNGLCGAESGWVPVSASSPSVLVSQLETQRKPKSQVKPPLLPPPASSEAAAETGLPSVVAAFQQGVDRAMNGLRMEGADSPSYVEVSAFDGVSASAVADFGTLRRRAGRPGRPGRVEVVVGTDGVTSSRISGDALSSLKEAVIHPRFAVGEANAAIARDLWLTTDASYKAALPRLAVKRAALAATESDRPPADPPWGEGGHQIDLSEVASVDQGSVDRLAEQLSAALKDLPEGLSRGEVTVRHVQGHYLRVTSSGEVLVQPEGYAVAAVEVAALRADGLELRDQRQWVAPTLDRLPSPGRLASEVLDVGRAVLARLPASLVDLYEGPVVFEGEAAADLFRYLLPLELQGTPPEPEAGMAWSAQLSRGPRLGRRLLPRGWSVVEDPTLRSGEQAGAGRFDREGVEARRVELVEDGYVRAMLLNRTPRLEGDRSTGHARGGIQGSRSAQMASWKVQPRRWTPKGAFNRAVSALRRASQASSVLVVRRLERGWKGGLPRPTHAVWQHADGTEVPALALEFAGVDRRVLRSIAAAQTGAAPRSYLASEEPWGRAPEAVGLPTVLHAPDRVLISEMEVTAAGPLEVPWLFPPPPLSPESPR